MDLDRSMGGRTTSAWTTAGWDLAWTQTQKQAQKQTQEAAIFAASSFNIVNLQKVTVTGKDGAPRLAGVYFFYIWLAPIGRRRLNDSSQSARPEIFIVQTRTRGQDADC